jgi:NitT/TauT family transport system permease protein
MSAALDTHAGPARRRRLPGFLPELAGVAILLVLWWLGGAVLAANPATNAFKDFAPGPTFAALATMAMDGQLAQAALPSLGRIAAGLGSAILLGVPAGIAIGSVPWLRRATYVPFQFLRMISPLSWMPLAVLVFPGWNGAIIFLITAAAVWPVLFATAQGVSRIDPAWLKVARNLRAGPLQRLLAVIMPAIAQDVLTGVRLALGVAWIVLVPTEYLGVSSGLGYAIDDARDTLDYASLTAIVITIGVIGFCLDAICLAAIRSVAWNKDN